MTTITKFGFVTYNTLPSFENGWVKSKDGSRQALIVQDTNGRGSLTEGGRTRSQGEIEAEIAKLWEGLGASLNELDRLVVYVGSNGSERAIEQAAKMPAEKLTFIGCRCGLEKKEAMVQAAGLGNAQRMLCECGGHHTMTEMIRRFLGGETLS